jgi:hypothetical protein
MKTLLYLFFFFVTPLLAQKTKKPSKFRVLVEQGEVYQVSKKISLQKKEPKYVLAGSTLYLNTIINIPSNSYLLLTDKAGNMLEFTQAYNLDMDSLEQYYKPQERTWGQKYNSHIFTDLIDASKIDINKNHRRYPLGVAAVVSRGGCRCMPSIADIYVPQNLDPLSASITYLFGKDSITLRLYKNPLANGNDSKKLTFQITILDFYNKIIHTDTASASLRDEEALIHIDISKLLKKPEENEFLVSVTIQEYREPAKERTTYYFNIVDYQKRMSLLLEEPTISLTPHTTLDNLYLIYFYEKNGYPFNAFYHLERLIAQRPQVDAFKILYEDFKVRHHMRPYLARKGDDKYKTFYYLTIAPTEDDYIKSKYFETRP